METNKEEKKSINESFQIIEKLILDGEAPQHIKIAAAKGALPLSPLSLLRLCVFLLKDEDKSVQSEASKGIHSIAEDRLCQMLKDRKCHPSVLSFFASEKRDNKAFLESIVQNPSATDDILSGMAEFASTEILEIIIMNEQRLISTPMILESMNKNPNLTDHLRSKILELREKFPSGEMRGEPPESGKEKEIELEEETLPTIDLEEEVDDAHATIDIDATLSESYIIDGNELDTSPQEIKDTYRKILTMSVPEKIVKALKGNHSERSILVRDSNRLVSITVLKNAKLSDQEVESFSAMKNLDEDVLREIGKTREWTKHYPVCLNLVRNPKTPPAISTTLIHRMTNADLKQIRIDKNVPELIRTMAKKTLDIRTQKAIAVTKRGKGR